MTTREQERNLINIRRSRITELLAKGYTNQGEIARTFNISEPTVSRDIQYLNHEAQESSKNHIESIALRYSIAETGYKMVLRKAFEISDNPNNTTSENLQSISSITNIIGRLTELSTDERTIGQAISWIENKKKELQQELQQEQQQEPALQSEAGVEEEEQEELEQDNGSEGR
jgi:DNA-binding CsgD family transcriptional regulator